MREARRSAGTRRTDELVRGRPAVAVAPTPVLRDLAIRLLDLSDEMAATR